MNTNYKELLQQREALDKQIAEARRAETSSAVAQARALIAEFNLSVSEVFPSGRATRGTAANRGSKVAPKYRNGATGDTWTGRGKAPKWIADQDRSQFLIVV